MKAWLLGMLVATAIAVPLGLLLGLNKLAHTAANMVIELFRPIPSVALIPIGILQFGRGIDLKIALIAYACLWPILFNTIHGVHAVDSIRVDSAKVFGLSRRQRITGVYLPSSAPFIFTGLKIASSVALILAVSVEIVAGGREGLGILLEGARQLGELKLSYAVIIMLGVIGVVLQAVFEFVERRAFGWTKFSGGDS